MIQQRLERVTYYFIVDLIDFCNDVIAKKNQEGWLLTSVQFYGIEQDTGNGEAFLLFQREEGMDKKIKNLKKKIDKGMDALVKADIPRDKKIEKCDKVMKKKKK